MTTLEALYHHWPQTPRSGTVREIPNVGRDDFAVLLGQLGYTFGVEVGTERGEYAEILCKANPELDLFCIDPWLAYGDYRDHVSQNKLDTIRVEAHQRLSAYNVHYVYKKSIEAAGEFGNGSIDFVYLDANHSLPYVIADLHAWVPKVRRGGIVSGHDFIRRNNSLRYQCHVVEAVYAWTQAYMVAPWFVLGTKGKLDGNKREAIRSFMWVKQ